MTRRIILTMVGVVAGALVAATLGTVALLRVEGRADARAELADEAERIAQRIETFQREGVLAALVAARALESGAILRIAPSGRLVGPVPAGLEAADLDLERLRAGETVTGSRGSLVFAAAGTRRGPATMAVVLTRRVGSGVPGGPWLAVVAAAALAAAAAVAANLGRRLTRPIRAAQDATRRIAAGDLAARVPGAPGADHGVGLGGDELADLARSINAMAASLERSRGLERQFLLSVSHDLRTPLTSIRGYADALAEGRAPDPAHAAGVIQSEARRLERLVGDLLELARLGARRFSLDLRPTDVAEVLADVASGFGPAAAGAGVELEVAAPGGEPLLAAADPDRLAQVVANLVENALRHARSRIVLGAGPGPAGPGVALWVEDDGPGIAPADLAHVFEAFFQSQRAPARPVGTGLGLAIVHELVGAMGGTVTAGARLDGGTRMEVRLSGPGATEAPVDHPG